MKKNLNLITALLVSLLICPAFAAEPSMDDMIGQMIVTGFTGDSQNSKGFKEITEKLNSGKISGVIFFENNIKNKEELNAMTTAVYEANMLHRPIISIDMEGGAVARMNSKNGFKNFPSAYKVANKSSKQAAEIYSLMAQELQGSLFNMNFAPVVDIDINENSILHKKERSFSSDYKKVEKYAGILMDAHFDKGIATSLKHFPGHGSVSGDTHLDFTDATKTFQEAELQPYRDLMFRNNLTTVMVSHIYNEKFDEIYPASLSYSTVTGLLREKMGYTGVVITDDLDMGAIRKNYNLDEIVIQAINAGCDILLFSNREKYSPNLAEDINKIVKEAILNGLINPERIKESYLRIQKFKQNMILAEPK